MRGVYYDWARNYNEMMSNYYAMQPVGNEIDTAKAEQPYLIGTANFDNRIYAQGYELLLNRDVNAYASTPKSMWQRGSGWRLVLNDGTPGTGNNVASDGSTLEGGKIAESTKGDILAARADIKHIQRTVKMSDIAELSGRIGDNTAMDFAEARDLAGEAFNRMLEAQIMRDTETVAASDVKPYQFKRGANEPVRLTCYDSIYSSKAEADALDASTAANKGHYNCYYDMAGTGHAYQRTANTNTDATVLTCNASGTIGGDNGILTEDKLYEAIYDTGDASGAGVDVMFISWTMQRQLNNMFKPSMRVAGENVMKLGETTVEFGNNGIRPGTKAGFQVASVNDIPLIPTNRPIKRASDTKEAGRVLGIYTGASRVKGMPNVSLCVAKPYRYWVSSSLDDPTGPAVNDEYTERAGFDIYQELICVNPKRGFKIRDCLTD